MIMSTVFDKDSWDNFKSLAEGLYTHAYFALDLFGVFLELARTGNLEGASTREDTLVLDGV